VTRHGSSCSNVPDRHILLEVPSQDENGAQVRELLTKGALGVAAIINTDDCRGTYEDLVAKGVEFTQEPVDQSYGVDCALRDPFGNQIRIGNRAAGSGDI